MATLILMQTWFQTCHALLSTTWTFILNYILFPIFAFLLHVCKKSSTMELPITTPTFRQSGILGANTDSWDYGGMCRLSAGFARASRIARHRLAVYIEQSEFKADDNCDELKQDVPAEDPWSERLSEPRTSLPYMSSDSTFDNTTISASVSLDSHSVYSTPPNSIILHTPIITITPAQYSDSTEEDESDCQSSDKDDYQTATFEPVHVTGAAEQDPCSSVTSKPNLGKLAQRRGFHGPPIITSFPPSHALLSSLSIAFQSSSYSKSLDHTSYQTTSPIVYSPSSTGFASPRSPTTDSQANLAPCYEADSVSTRRDSFHTNCSQSKTNVADLTIYRLNEKAEGDIDTHHDEDVNISNDVGLGAKGRRLLSANVSAYTSLEEVNTDLDHLTRGEFETKSFLRSYLFPPLSVDIASSDDTPSSCPTTQVKSSPKRSRRVSTSSIGKHDVDNNAPPLASRRHPKHRAHRSTMTVTDGSLWAHLLTTQSEEMDSDLRCRFSFPYYLIRKSAREWNPNKKPTSAVVDLDASKPPSEVSSLPNSGPVQDVHRTVPTQKIGSLVPADSIAVDVGLCTPATNAISPLCDALLRSPDLSPSHGRMASKCESLPGSPAAPSQIPVEGVPSEFEHSSSLTEVEFSDRGRVVQDWISTVNSSLGSAAATGVSHLLPAVESPIPDVCSQSDPGSLDLPDDKNTAEEGLSRFRGERRRAKSDPRVYKALTNCTSRRPRSLGTISARSQAIALERHRSSVIYSCQHRLSEMSKRESALRPLMLPIRLASRGSIRESSNGNSNRDFESQYFSPSIYSGNNSASEMSFDDNRLPISHRKCQGPLSELLDALALDSVTDDTSDPSLSHDSCTAAVDLDRPDNDGLTLDSTTNWGIAL